MKFAERILLGLRRIFRAGYYADPASTLGAGTEVDDDAVIANSRVGARCKIGSRTEVRNGKLADDVRVAHDAHVCETWVDAWVALQVGVELIHCQVGSFTYFARRARAIATTFGKFCSVGPNVVCGCGEHPSEWISTSPIFYSGLRQCGRSFADTKEFEELAPVTIGSDCWIGANAVIKNGVKIGHGAIVAAGAVVTRDVEPYTIVAGVPARALRLRFEPEIVAELLAVAWWKFPDTVLEKEAARFRTSDGPSFLRWAKSVRSGG